MTSVLNLWPGCKADHKAKHTPGFSIEMTESGQFALKTPAGFSHEVLNSTHPVSDEWPGVPSCQDLQFSVAEFTEAVQRIREERAPAPDHVGLWEDGERAFWQFAEIEVSTAVYERAA